MSTSSFLSGGSWGSDLSIVTKPVNGGASSGGQLSWPPAWGSSPVWQHHCLILNVLMFIMTSFQLCIFVEVQKLLRLGHLFFSIPKQFASEAKLWYNVINSRHHSRVSCVPGTVLSVLLILTYVKELASSYAALGGRARIGAQTGSLALDPMLLTIPVSPMKEGCCATDPSGWQAAELGKGLWKLLEAVFGCADKCFPDCGPWWAAWNEQIQYPCSLCTLQPDTLRGWVQGQQAAFWEKWCLVLVALVLRFCQRANWRDLEMACRLLVWVLGLQSS